eukprot:2971402-Pleurochrysis_carterae.AAC.1
MGSKSRGKNRIVLSSDMSPIRCDGPRGDAVHIAMQQLELRMHRHQKLQYLLSDCSLRVASVTDSLVEHHFSHRSAQTCTVWEDLIFLTTITNRQRVKGAGSYSFTDVLL